MEKITVLIHCYNNEGIIKDCLESVKWADEIVVCDSFSTDKTIDICRKYTDKVYQHEHKNSADQKNWTIPKCSNKWILQVDTDERVADDLKNEIQELMKTVDDSYEAFEIPFKHYLFGKWIKGAGNHPDRKPRLFRRHLRFEEQAIHAHLNIAGKVGGLKGYILHLGWEDMATIRKRFKRHRALCAVRKRNDGRKYKLWHLFIRPPAVFLYLFICKRGFIDGWRGVFFCWSLALIEFYSLKDLRFSKKLH